MPERQISPDPAFWGAGKVVVGEVSWRGWQPFCLRPTIGGPLFPLPPLARGWFLGAAESRGADPRRLSKQTEFRHVNTRSGASPAVIGRQTAEASGWDSVPLVIPPRLEDGGQVGAHGR